VLGRVAFLGHLCQRNVADGDPEHYPLAVRIGQLFGQITSVFRTRTPSARVVDTLYHRRPPHG
jgi:hypothetical protein